MTEPKFMTPAHRRACQAAAVLICRPLQRFNASRFAPAHSVGFDQGVDQHPRKRRSGE